MSVASSDAEEDIGGVLHLYIFFSMTWEANLLLARIVGPLKNRI